MNTNFNFKQKQTKTKETERKRKNNNNKCSRGKRVSTTGWMTLWGCFSKTTSNCKFYIDILAQQVCIFCHIRYI